MPNLAEIPPPAPPSEMGYQYLCDWFDGNWIYGSVRQKTNSTYPATGWGVYIKKVMNTSDPIYIGIATLSQSTSYPTDYTQWASYAIVPSSSFTLGEEKWYVVHFDGPEYYVPDQNLYIMAYYNAGAWAVGTTADNSCLDCDRYLGGTWQSQTYGMTSCLLMQTSLVCGNYDDPTACQTNSCYWYCGACHHAQLLCSAYTTCGKTDCQNPNNGGCYWYNQSCHDAEPPNCFAITDPNDCTAYGCPYYCAGHCSETGVTCYRCNGETPESQTFCEGVICGEGTASQWPESSPPNCVTSCHNPDRPENKLACINGMTYKCIAGQWQTQNEPCVSDCEFQDYQSACENAGCYWYAYPNPVGEKKCQTRPWVEAYMPHIIIGTGIAAVAISILSLLPRKSPYSQPYYPPQPQQYAPRPRAPRKTTRRKK